VFGSRSGLPSRIRRGYEGIDGRRDEISSVALPILENWLLPGVGEAEVGHVPGWCGLVGGLDDVLNAGRRNFCRKASRRTATVRHIARPARPHVGGWVLGAQPMTPAPSHPGYPLPKTGRGGGKTACAELLGLSAGRGTGSRRDGGGGDGGKGV